VNRLTSIAVIVWGVGILLAVLISVLGATTLLGLDFSFGPLFSALAAIGSVSGALAALWIATTDRRDRRRKDDAADEARAKLVILSADRPDASGQLRVLVRNLGPDPMVDLAFVRLDCAGHQFNLVPFRHKWFPVLAPSEQKVFVIALPGNGDSFRKALTGYWDPPPPRLTKPADDATWFPPTIDADTMLTATIRFTDQNGNVWQRTASNKAVSEDGVDETLRIGPVLRIR
jgi:hypothetical protein